VAVALYERVRAIEPGFALLALLFATGGGLGAAIHGAYQLALAVEDRTGGDPLPNAVDPRGFLTFGLTALAVALFAALLRRSNRNLATLGFVLALLLAILWIGRLAGLDAEDAALLLPATLAGFVANPAWYAWLGRELGRGARIDL
jgi:hypothetical protein